MATGTGPDDVTQNQDRTDSARWLAHVSRDHRPVAGNQ
jgi:hypothetical protein